MLTMLKDYKGKLKINGVEYENIQDATKRFKATSKQISIQLYADSVNAVKTQNRASQSNSDIVDTIAVHKITVRQYMTKKATVDFDFMLKNNNIPMPLRTMIGTIEKETPGTVYMKLHADITEEKTQRCMCCGRVITNPISQYFGMGPECGGHNYVNPFYSEEELKAAVSAYREQLRKITWEGWIIKSAITEDIIL